MDVWRLVATLLMVAAGVGWLTFVAMYWPTSWRGTPEGRHLMLTRAGLGLIVAAWATARVLRDKHEVEIPQWVWALVILPTTVAAWQGVALLRRRQREAKRAKV